jgi:ketosteroid isomerase-like protein
MTLQEFFNQYSQAYSALDARAVYAMFTRPFTAVHHGQIATFGSNETEALYQATVGILDYYRDQGVTSASCHLAEVLPFGSDLATVKVRWTARRTRPNRGCCHRLPPDTGKRRMAHLRPGPI